MRRLQGHASNDRLFVFLAYHGSIVPTLFTTSPAVATAARISLDEIDAVLAQCYGMDRSLLSAHGYRAGPGKAVAVESAARLAEMSGRLIGEHYGIGAAAVGANHRRLADRPEMLQVVDTLTRQLPRTKRE
ncbi:MAG: hypothetical protein ACLP9L_35710 [Thermoguttaceae bacterium]